MSSGKELVRGFRGFKDAHRPGFFAARLKRTAGSKESQDPYALLNSYFAGQICESGICSDEELDSLLAALAQVEEEQQSSGASGGRSEESGGNGSRGGQSGGSNSQGGGIGQQLVSSLPQLISSLLGGGGGGLSGLFGGGGGGAAGASGGGLNNNHMLGGGAYPENYPMKEPVIPPRNMTELANSKAPEQALDSLTKEELEKMYNELSEEEKKNLECYYPELAQELKERLEEEETEADKKVDEYEKLVAERDPSAIPKQLEFKQDQIQEITGAKPNPRNEMLFDSPPIQQELTRMDAALRERVANGSMTPQEAASVYLATEQGIGRMLAQAEKLDTSLTSVDWNPAFPLDNTGMFGDNNWRTRNVYEAAGATRAITNELLDTRTPVVNFQAHGVSVNELALANAIHFADPTTSQQGPFGACWTQGTKAFSYWNAPADIFNAQHQALWEGKFTSPYNGTTYTVNQAILKPSGSSQVWNPEKLTGDLSYADQVDQVMVANASGYNTPNWGGNTPSAYNGLEAITGYQQVPSQHSVGGRPGFIELAQDGRATVGQRYSIPRHADQVQATYANGQALVMGDNSWGPGNEQWYLAVPENAQHLDFPWGGGALGGGLGGLGNIIRLPVNGGGGLSGLYAGGIKQPDKEQDDQNILEDEKNHERLVSLCQQAASKGGTMPDVCKRFGITDDVLPKTARTRLTAGLDTSSSRPAGLLLFRRIPPKFTGRRGRMRAAPGNEDASPDFTVRTPAAAGGHRF